MHKLIASLLTLLLLAACSPTLPPLERALSGPEGEIELSCRNGVVHIACIVDTPTPTETPIPPTETPAPTATVTPVAGTCPEHENAWHAPADADCQRHHHGVDPRDYADVFSIDGFDLDPFLDDYGELRQAWETSIGEEWTGYIWIYEHIDDCEQYAPAGNPNLWINHDCVTDALIRVHDTGTAAHFLKRFHSETFIVKGCAKGADGLPDFTKCGIIATGDHHDYGILHTPYKQAHCPILGQDPPDFFSLDQPPYRAHTTIDPTKPDPEAIFQFWSGQPPNPINNPGNAWYPHGPNSLVGFGWSSVDAWQNFDPAICGQELAVMQALAEQFPVVEGMQHVTFQIWNLRVFTHPAGPFTGFTDQHGHLWPEGVCMAASPSCIPIIITAGFPDRRIILQRRVDQGNCDVAPCLVIDTGGVEMVFPGEDVP